MSRGLRLRGSTGSGTLLGLRGGLRGDRIDFDLRGRTSGERRPIRKAFGVRGVGGIERTLPNGSNVLDATIEDVFRREEGEPGVMVLVVVPAEELLEPATSVLDAAESTGVVGFGRPKLNQRV